MVNGDSNNANILRITSLNNNRNLFDTEFILNQINKNISNIVKTIEKVLIILDLNNNEKVTKLKNELAELTNIIKNIN